MPRKGPAGRRDIRPDYKYHSTIVAQLINKILLKGKGSVAEGIVYDAFDIIEKKTKEDPVTIYKKAVENIRPQLEVKSRRVGGATYQVPMEVRPRRATTIALRWLVKNARGRREHTMQERLAYEIMDAANSTGASVKNRDDTHKMAEANKAFAHYRW